MIERKIPGLQLFSYTRLVATAAEGGRTFGLEPSSLPLIDSYKIAVTSAFAGDLLGGP